MRTLEQYESVLKDWPRAAGKRPTVGQFKAVEQDGLARPGSKAAVALAMAMRPEGTTQPQIISVLGQAHRNKIKEVSTSKAVRVLKRTTDSGIKIIKLVPRHAA